MVCYLSAFGRLILDKAVCGRPVGTVHDARFDRKPVRRLFVKKGHVHLAVKHHAERSRERCRAHDEKVRHHALFQKRLALLHAETVLLVNDHEPEFMKRDTVLEQRVRADCDVVCAFGKAL